MYHFEGIKTNALRTMLVAYTSDYGRSLTTEETRDRLITITELQNEIASRDDTTDILPVVTLQEGINAVTQHLNITPISS